MIIAFIIWSIVAVLFLAIGISSRKSREAVGFFTFTKPPVIENIEAYNRAVSNLWIVTALIFELLGIPFLFLKQNSPWFLLIIFAVFIWVITMMVCYMKIEGKYRKK